MLAKGWGAGTGHMYVVCAKWSEQSDRDGNWTLLPAWELGI